MVEVLILGVGALIVVAIALVAVGGGVAKTTSMPPQIVYNVEESIDFCAEALPDEVTATMSYDELRIALRLHLEWIQAYHFTPDGIESPLIFEDTDALDYLMERADIVGLNLSRAHGRQVMDAHYAYFQFMGAIHLEDPKLVAKDLADAGVLDPALLEAGAPDAGALDGGAPDPSADRAEDGPFDNSPAQQEDRQDPQN